MLFLNSVEQPRKRTDENKGTALRLTGMDRRAREREYIRYLDDPCPDTLVGVKNAALARLHQRAAGRILIPDTFIIAADAYSAFLARNQLITPITQALEDLDPDNVTHLVKTARKIRKWIIGGRYPAGLKQQITDAWTELLGRHSQDMLAVVRSSLTVEDIPVASLYSGQQSAYLNVRDLNSLLKACKHVFASLFSERAIAYCAHHGIDPMDVKVAVGVQRMVRSDLAVSGVNFSFEPQTGFDEVISVSSSYGLGENIGKGRVSPDEFLVSRTMLQKGYRSIIKRQLGSKQTTTVPGGNKLTAMTSEVSVPIEDRKRFSLTDDEVIALANMTMEVEEYFSDEEGRRYPLSIEWAQDGFSGEFHIIQVGYEKVRLSPSATTYTEYQLQERGWTLAVGAGVGHKIVSGVARVVTDLRDIESLQSGEVLVLKETIPEIAPYLARAAALVADLGGRCCHSASIVQTHDIPAVLGCGNATETIRTGDEVTVVCIERNMGYVYEGRLAFQRVARPSSNLAQTDTNLMLVVSNPEMAWEHGALPADGAGLVKMEYVVNSHIKAHPRAILEYEGQAPDVQFTIDELTAGYPSRRDYYVQKLSEGIAMIAAAFYPRPVMVRTSDFKSNEYAALYGGEFFESHELNPVMGLRGAARYFSEEFQESFALECEAIRLVREQLGFTNVEVTLPFVRTVEESRKITELMASFGLRRGENGLRIRLMCETPANALLADEFLDDCDGLIIGTDDLVQLTVGIDRDCKVFQDFDERDKSVLKLIYLVIEACHRRDKSLAVCGSMVTRYPELVRWFVEKDVGGIIVPPEEFFATHSVVSRVEALRKSRSEGKVAATLLRSA